MAWIVEGRSAGSHWFRIETSRQLDGFADNYPAAWRNAQAWSFETERLAKMRARKLNEWDGPQQTGPRFRHAKLDI